MPKRLGRSAISHTVHLTGFAVSAPPTSPPFLHGGCGLQFCHIRPFIGVECSVVGKQPEAGYCSASHVFVRIDQQTN